MRFTAAVVALQVCTIYAAFAPSKTSIRTTKNTPLFAEGDEKVTVRFVNYNSQGETTVKQVDKGDNILNVADSAGVYIPRNCRSGLCGSCTADMIDPSWEVGSL